MSLVGLKIDEWFRLWVICLDQLCKYVISKTKTFCISRMLHLQSTFVYSPLVFGARCDFECTPTVLMSSFVYLFEDDAQDLRFVLAVVYEIRLRHPS